MLTIPLNSLLFIFVNLSFFLVIGAKGVQTSEAVALVSVLSLNFEVSAENFLNKLSLEFYF